MKLSFNAFSLDDRILSSGKDLTLYHTIPTFNDPEENFMKTSFKKEKMLVTSIFSFSPNVFYSIKNKNHHFSNSAFVVCKSFEFGRV